MQVTVVGAGVAGLSTALALSHASPTFNITIYESHSPATPVSGAVMLSPNALRLLDRWGLYASLKTKGHNFQSVDMQNPIGKSLDRQYLGSESDFGYDALRIYRDVYLTTLSDACLKRGITIYYDKKFNSIVTETDSNITVQFSDGQQITTDLLIAADGIHSKIRQILYPDIKPIYNGLLVVAGAVPRSKLVFPRTENENANQDSPIVQLGTANHGPIVIAPQLSDASEYLVGTQKPYPEQDRAGWERIASDKTFQQTFLQEGLENRSELAKSAITGILEDRMYIWPQHTLPKLPRWASKGGRVVIVGDAAHALPPTAGQGGNQAVEDAWGLGVVMKTVFDAHPDVVQDGNGAENKRFKEALAFWQSIRESRIAKLLDMTRRLNNSRLPLEQQEKLKAEDLWEAGKGADGVRWLFGGEWEGEVERWARDRGSA